MTQKIALIFTLALLIFPFTTAQVSSNEDPCPQGTPEADVIVCTQTPPVGSNTTQSIRGFAGDDSITVEEMVSFDLIDGGAGEDIIVNSGDDINPDNNDLGWIYGDDLVAVDGFDDEITNYGIVESIRGEKIDVDDDNAPFVTGGADIIVNHGTVGSNIYGDWVEGWTYDRTTGAGGNDTIINYGTVGNEQLRNAEPQISWSMSEINGDVGALLHGDDNIINHGRTVNITGDGGEGLTFAGDDTITNTETGLVDHHIYGDWIGIPDNTDTTQRAGSDTITNAGTVGLNIYGDFFDDYATYAIEPIGWGAADLIINSGTVGGSIFAEGGDDTVRLQDGANGGDDNVLPIYGGQDFDTLDFDFTALTDSELAAIANANPSSGSVTIGGQTFNFVEFEAITVNGAAFSFPERLYPLPDAVLDASNYVGPNFSFRHIDGVDWYGVWIGTLNPTSQAIYQWFPATAQSEGITTETPICDTQTMVCTLPADVWLGNGDYSWWMTYWGPTFPDWQSYWNGTTFSVDFDAPPPGALTNVTPSGTVNTPPTQVTWDRDPNVLWMEIWLGQVVGPGGTPYTAFYNWVDATEICNVTTCTLTLDETILPIPDGDYEMWMRLWGPGGFLEWTDVNGNVPAATFSVETSGS